MKPMPVRACLCALALGLILGCANNPQLGFQPAGHDNEFKVAEEMRIGDKGRDIDKSTTKISAPRLEGERVTLSEFPPLGIVAAVALTLLVATLGALALWQRSLIAILKHCLQVMQQFIADQQNRGMISEIKPLVRAMGTRAKKVFDSNLKNVKNA